ncbi:MULTISPECIES: AAA family ATPase [unclassified Bacillus (in: firmicutes)]|uniref:ParA family protein n=1 Tax=unclassified Bacillus (in: firmicutes) TaxID=185979 RepID=UPI0023DC7363|nr:MULTISPECIES: AAA family ATPase [unclassified Bacillus (in: firmicutes)]MCU4759987.1 AAA family ATPase [Bacillus cereus]MDA2124291.1 AAA family ATPase [Bacillus cereus]MDF2016452.1 AAA family ATPase [Bacillus sp. Cr_R3]MDF2033805.1 AAA family ATPase [Bacillus sp. Cr_R16]
MTEVEVKDPAKVISFINMKGGVGKTTLTKEIGYFLATKRNKKMLFIDLDPQSNLTQSFFRKYNYSQEDLLDVDDEQSSETSGVKVAVKKKNYTNASIHKLFTPGKVSELTKEDCILKLDDNISIIPGTLKSVFSERNSNIENHLYNYVDRHKLKNDFDYIFIDCPPTYSNYTIAALITSDYYATPTRPDSYSVLGIDMLDQVVKQIKDHHKIYFQGRELKALGVVYSDLQIPNTGIQNLKTKIMQSEKIRNLGINFFDNDFVYNSHLPKQAEYFITDSNSNKIEELTILVDEFERRASE